MNRTCKFAGFASALVVVLALAGTLPCSAKGPKPKKTSEKPLDQYLAQFSQQQSTPQQTSLGSLWVAQSPLANGVTDYRALKIGDPVTLQITESTLSTSSGSVNAQRQFSASSGIDGLPGRIKTAGVSTLFSGKSDSSLKGSGATTYNATIRTTLAGQVVAMLPNGNLVLEARRSVLMNNDRQEVIIRGMVRPTDIGPSNAVLSTQLSNLEIEMKGKGIVADNTRPPNLIMRMLLRIIGF
jgi:flagellar L-ring protein precursor FlgH